MRGRHRVGWVGRLVAKLCILGLVLPVAGIGAGGNAAATEAELAAAVERATAAYLGSRPPAGISYSATDEVADWAFGTVAVRLPPNVDGIPQALFFLARKTGRGWEAAVGPTATFERWVGEAPAGLIPRRIAATLDRGTIGAAGAPDSLRLSLPWATDETWALWSGPHDSHVAGVRNALDFSGGTGQIRAAAPGVALTDFGPSCQNLVKIAHGADGWQTTYYHVANVAVSHGQAVARGQFLGMQSEAVGCGGFAVGAHQHFGVELNQTPQAIAGTILGGWTVQAGANQRDGCMSKAGNTQCAPNGQIFNDGTIGNSTPKLRLTPTAASPGTRVRASLTGFKSLEEVTLRMTVGGRTVGLATVTVSANGVAKPTFRVPRAQPRRYLVEADGSRGSRATARFEVT